MIILFNKSDLLLATQKEELSAIFADMKVEKLFISAKKRENITILEKKLVQAAALPTKTILSLQMYAITKH